MLSGELATGRSGECKPSDSRGPGCIGALEETTANKEASDEKKEATKQEKGMWDDEVSSMRSLRADDDEVAKDGSVWS